MTQVPRVQNCGPISTFAEKLNTQLHLDLALMWIIMRFPSDHLRSYDLTENEVEPAVMCC